MLCVNTVKNELGYKSIINPRRTEFIFETFQHYYFYFIIYFTLCIVITMFQIDKYIDSYGKN
jgi:hypothetical protein